jgi:hypothetical protein
MSEQAFQAAMGTILQFTILVGMIVSGIVTVLNKLDLSRNSRDNAAIQDKVDKIGEALNGAVSVVAEQIQAAADEISRLAQLKVKAAQRGDVEEIVRLHDRTTHLHGRISELLTRLPRHTPPETPA